MNGNPHEQHERGPLVSLEHSNAYGTLERANERDENPRPTIAVWAHNQ